MSGFLSIFFGRPREIHLLDGALRRAGLHPRLVADAVKIAAVKLVKEAAGPHPDEAALAAAADMLAYCILGPEDFAAANGADPTEAVEARVDRAVQAGDDLDARLILLTMGAGAIAASTREKHGLRAD